MACRADGEREAADRRWGAGSARRWFARTVVCGLAAVVVAAYAGTIACGRADNGDFMKIARGYVEKPSGFTSAWPDSPVERDRRFFTEWLPTWVLRPDGRFDLRDSKRSSGHASWLAGAVLARPFGDGMLDLRLLSLPARVASATLAILAVVRLAGAAPASVVPAVLFAAIATDVGYLSFLNTWYEEGPTLAYVLALWASLLAWAGGRGRLAFGAIVAAGIALTTCRSVNCLFGLALLPLCGSRRRWIVRADFAGNPSRRARIVAAALLVGASLTSALVVARYPEDPLVNPFNTLFFGALTFADSPAPHLQRLGFGSEAHAFVGNPIFVGDAHAFAYAHPTSITFTSALSVYAHEPRALLRALWFAVGRLHDTRLAYLPLHAAHAGGGWMELDAWQRLKLHLHASPSRSATWLAALVLSAAALLRDRRRAACGAIALVLLACAFAGLATAILGDGRQEIEKHLWTVNLLLDLATSAVVAGWFGPTLQVPPRAPNARPRA